MCCGPPHRWCTCGCTDQTRDHLYGGSYPDADLRWWADRVREWAATGKDVYVYFNNDGAGNAVRNAVTLRDMVGA